MEIFSCKQRAIKNSHTSWEAHTYSRRTQADNNHLANDDSRISQNLGILQTFSHRFSAFRQQQQMFEGVFCSICRYHSCKALGFVSALSNLATVNCILTSRTKAMPNFHLQHRDHNGNCALRFCQRGNFWEVFFFPRDFLFHSSLLAYLMGWIWKWFLRNLRQFLEFELEDEQRLEFVC